MCKTSKHYKIFELICRAKKLKIICSADKNMKKLSIIILSLFVSGFGIMPAFASGRDNHDNDRESLIANSNIACVENSAITVAKTGDNIADGSYAGNGGTAGGIVNSGDEDIDESSTGNGGSGGDSGIGGTVSTGIAIATTNITNDVNKNVQPVGDETVLMNRNMARLSNKVITIADTGDNKAGGSIAGTGGNGGTISSGGHHKDGGSIDDSTTGGGGTGGSTSEGGMVISGDASSNTTIMNIVNRNITRVRR